MHWEDEKLMVIMECSGSVNFEFEFESDLGRGKVDEFELKVTWEEGKLMNLN